MTAYIGLGSNLPSKAGNSEATLKAAITRLHSLGAVTAQSSFYKTAPVGSIEQPDFTNAALALETALSPLALLDSLLAIELEFGRDRTKSPPKGPRTLDLDLLLIDAIVFDHDRLTLPHPAMAERRFVLEPLAEIAPNAVHPSLGRTISQLLSELNDSETSRKKPWIKQ